MSVDCVVRGIEVANRVANSGILHIDEYFVASDFIEVDSLELEVCFWLIHDKSLRFDILALLLWGCNVYGAEVGLKRGLDM